MHASARSASNSTGLHPPAAAALRCPYQPCKARHAGSPGLLLLLIGATGLLSNHACLPHLDVAQHARRPLREEAPHGALFRHLPLHILQGGSNLQR